VRRPWPLYQSDSIVVSNPDSDVAVLTLWTDAKRIARGLRSESFSACGNLYSRHGFNFVLRNLLANPRVRYLVLCGADVTGTAEVVKTFFSQSEAGGDSLNAGDDFGLPEQAVRALRSGVRLLSLIGESDPARIQQEIDRLPRLSAWGEPMELALVGPSAVTLTAEEAGFVVHHESAARAWVQVLKLAVQFATPAARPRRARELLAVTVVLEGAAHPEESASWFLGTGPASSESVARVRAAPRATVLLHPGGHSLGMTVWHRQIDLVRDWPRLLVMQRQEHRRRSEAAGLHVGTLVLSTARVLLRERDLEYVRGVLARRYPRTLPWRSDPRGLFWIRVEGTQVVVEHGTQAGPSGRSWRGESAEQLCRVILNEQLVGLREHAAYLGRELQRAETAARWGLAFRQDAPLAVDEGLPPRLE
jgi:hypothetical protein